MNAYVKLRTLSTRQAKRLLTRLIGKSQNEKELKENMRLGFSRQTICGKSVTKVL
jgi:hypothetical protein